MRPHLLTAWSTSGTCRHGPRSTRRSLSSVASAGADTTGAAAVSCPPPTPGGPACGQQPSVADGHSYASRTRELTWQDRDRHEASLSSLSLSPSASHLVHQRSPIKPPGGATFPRRQHAALRGASYSEPAVLLELLLSMLHGLSKEGRFSELSINRAIEWRLNNVESQLHCHLRPVASVIVSLAAAHYYYPFIMGLGSASLMTRVFVGTRVVFVGRTTHEACDTRCVDRYGDHWSYLNGFHGTRYTRPGGAPGGRPRSGHAALNTRRNYEMTLKGTSTLGANQRRIWVMPMSYSRLFR